MNDFLKCILIFSFNLFMSCDSAESDGKTVSGNSTNPDRITYPLPSSSDSLIGLLHKLPDDSNKVNVFNALAWELSGKNADTSLLLGNKALLIAQKINWKPGIGKTIFQIGWFKNLKGDYPAALDYGFSALAIWENLIAKGPAKQKTYFQYNESKTLNSIGIAYKNQGDNTKALDYYLKALKSTETLKNNKSRVSILGNLGIIYQELGNNKQALDCYFKAEKIYEELGMKYDIAINLINIGNLYFDTHDYQKALGFYSKVVSMNDGLKNKNIIATAFTGIAGVYFNQTDYVNSSKYYFMSLKIHREYGDKHGAEICLGNIGAIYIKTGKFAEAEKFLKEGLQISTELNAINNSKDQYLLLSQLYDTIRQPQLALEYFKKFRTEFDSIVNGENNKKQTRLEMNYEFDKKQNVEKAEQGKKDAIAQADARRQKVILSFVIGGLVLVVLFAGFIFRSLRITRKQKEIIEIKSRETELQKILIEEKNKDILDSIHYAKRIQQSLLPTEKFIDKNLKRLQIIK